QYSHRRKFERRASVAKQVVRRIETGVEILPVRHALQGVVAALTEPLVVIGSARPRRCVTWSLLGRNPSVVRVEPQSDIKREFVEGPLLLGIHAKLIAAVVTQI